jgi:serine/threonine-protein kinase
VHRDLKLQNILLADTPEGELIKVLDFGIAKHSSRSLALTSASSMMGTPRFMPPEQFICARDVDERGDVWALGVCAYKLLTGLYPFEGSDLEALCRSVVGAAAPHVSDVEPNVPRAVGDVIMTCLAHDREARFANAVELAAALERTRASVPSRPPAQHVDRSSMTRVLSRRALGA